MHANTRLKPARQANKSSDLEIIYRPLSELKLHPTNPRLHRKKQIWQIKESVRVFGFLVPIQLDRHGRVIAGHGRLLAARELGIQLFASIT